MTRIGPIASIAAMMLTAIARRGERVVKVKSGDSARAVIQQEIDSLPKAGGTVFIPAGRYVLDGKARAVFTSCTFADNLGYGIFFSSTPEMSTGNSVVGCVFTGNTKPALNPGIAGFVVETACVKQGNDKGEDAKPKSPCTHSSLSSRARP